MKLFKIQYLFLLVGCLVMFSCSNDNDDEELGGTETIDHIWGIAPAGEYCDMAYFDLEEGNVALFDFNERKIDMIFNEEQMLASIVFNNKGLIESLYVDSLTLLFSNHHENKIDIAFLFDDEEVEIIKDYETQINWDELVYKIPMFDYSVESRNVFVDADKWLRNNQNGINEFFETTDKMIQAIEGAFTLNITMPSGNKLNKLKKGESIGKFVGKFAADLGVEEAIDDKTIENVLDLYDAFSLYREKGIGDGRFTVVKQFNIYRRYKLIYTGLKLALTNYTEWSDFCERFWYQTISSYYDYHKAKEELGSGALLRIAINSYEHTLPAMHNEGNVIFTLSTNATYTRMESDVKEWGVALFKGNELIEKYPVESLTESTQFVKFSFNIAKKQFNLDYNNYIATPKDEWYLKAYEINSQNPNIPIFGRSKIALELVYNQKPSITIKDLEVGETIDFNDGNWDRATPISYKTLVTGSLFMEDYYEYKTGDWIDEGKGKSYALYDSGGWSYPERWLQFSSKGVNGTDYFYYIGIVNGKKISSTNYMRFDFNGKNCTISLVDGTVDSRASRSVVDKASALECGSGLIERRNVIFEE